jgi:hypothetical protein
LIFVVKFWKIKLYLDDLQRRKVKNKISAPDFISKMTRRKSMGKKRRMGQFYKTSYFKMQLKKIAELPEEIDEDEEESPEYTKSAEESKSNPTSNENAKSFERDKVADMSKSTTPKISKGSMDETSSLPSSVSSQTSSVVSPIAPFNILENVKRVSNISVESLTDYNKRKSESKETSNSLNALSRQRTEVDQDRRDTAVIQVSSKLSIYNDVHKPDFHQNQNIFKIGRSPPSESSDAYTFMSGARFGGPVTNSDRGSIVHSFKSPNFKIDNYRKQQESSENESFPENRENDEENFDF